MSDVLSYADVDGQHVELLPARTVMSMFRAGCGCEGGGGAKRPATAVSAVTVAPRRVASASTS